MRPVELPRALADQFVQRRRLVDVLAVGDYRVEHDIPLSTVIRTHPRRYHLWQLQLADGARISRERCRKVKYPCDGRMRFVAFADRHRPRNTGLEHPKTCALDRIGRKRRTHVLFNDLASLGTFVSSFAVLVLLIFLGIQTRQSTRNQRATIHHERLATVQELALLGTQAEAAELGIRGSAGDESLSPVQTRQYLTVSLCTLRIMEELFYQHRDGMLDEARWATTPRRQRGFLSAPGFRAAWRTLAETFEPDYRAGSRTRLRSHGRRRPEWARHGVESVCKTRTGTRAAPQST